jgi:hypothetical protein
VHRQVDVYESLSMDRSATACLVLIFVVSCNSVVVTVDRYNFVDVDGQGADVFASSLQFHPENNIFITFI